MYIIIATIISRACSAFNTDIVGKTQTAKKANEILKNFNFQLKNELGYQITNSDYWNTVAFNKTSNNVYNNKTTTLRRIKL